MVSRTTVHCDRCNAELLKYSTTTFGIHSTGSLAFNVITENMSMQDREYVPDLFGGDYCSYECFAQTLDETVDAIKKAIGEKRYGADT